MSLNVSRVESMVQLTDSNVLFEPLQAGEILLKNRIVMAPLTRCRAGEGRVPQPLNAEYYRQRAGAGMILSEATAVHPMGVGYPDTPGMWNDEQVEGWKLVTQAVHEAGGTILCQLWHVGRISHSSYLGGKMPLAPSAVAAEGNVSLIRPQTAFETPRALELEEIPLVVEQYRQASIRARDAGFDGIEVHGANGYLIDQFLHTRSNRREDKYGGSIENRSRFLLEVVDACVGVWGAGRVGVHLAPKGDSHDVGSEDARELFCWVARALGERKLAFLCAREPWGADALGPELKKQFGGVYIANQGFTREQAKEVIGSGQADAVAFGQLYIANPDLAERFRMEGALNDPDPSTYYGQGERGYTDYPFLDRKR